MRRSRRLSIPAQPETPKGVNLIGFIRAELGVGESVRNAARALQTADVPFGILNMPHVISNRMEDLSWVHREMGKPVYRINLFHLNADFMHHAHTFFGHGLFRRRYNIGYWHWELPDFRDEDMYAFKLVHEVWVPSHFIQESVKKKSPVPVIRIPHGIHVEVPPQLNRDTFGLPHHRYLFLSMYDVQSITQRKNPQAVIEAFKLAFGPDDPHVGLVLKINNINSQPSEMAMLAQLIHGYSNIFLIDRVLFRNEVNGLLNCTDCFVSLHRSEGFGLGLAEAMYLGKPVIATNWSGNTDFMNPANSCPVDYHLVTLGQDYGPYKAYQTWAEPDLHHAAEYMKELMNNPEWRNRIAFNGQETILTKYSPLVVGQLIRHRLASLGLL